MLGDEDFLEEHDLHWIRSKKNRWEDHEDMTLEEGGLCCMCFRGTLATIAGVLLLLACAALLVGTEAHHQCNAHQFAYAAAAAEDVPDCDSGAEKDKFIFFSCPLQAKTLPLWKTADFPAIDGVPAGPLFNAAAARRKIEMERCVETDEGQGLFSYQKQWGPSGQVPQPRDCAAAERACGSLACQSYWGRYKDNAEITRFAASVEAGPYTVVQELLAMGALRTFETVGGWKYATCSDTLGCIRVGYQQPKYSDVSVVAHTGETSGQLTKHVPPFTRCPGVWMLAEGKLDREQMLQAMLQEGGGAHIGQGALTWTLRVVGIGLMTLSMYLLLRPFAFCFDLTGNVVRRCPCLVHCVEGAQEGVIESIMWVMAALMSIGCCVLIIGVFWAGVFPFVFYAALAFFLLTCYCVILSCKRPTAVARSSPKLDMIRPKLDSKPSPAKPSQEAPAAMARAQHALQTGVMIQPVITRINFGVSAAPQEDVVRQVQDARTVQLVSIKAPECATAGMPLTVCAPDGREVALAVQQGVGPEQEFQAYV